MATSPGVQRTDFTRDVLGRYICNGLDEALHSGNPTAMRPDGRLQTEARPFDLSSALPCAAVEGAVVMRATLART
jgi:hypothetical protein